MMREVVPFSYLKIRRKVVEETRVPGENHSLTPSHWQLSHMLIGSELHNGGQG